MFSHKLQQHNAPLVILMSYQDSHMVDMMVTESKLENHVEYCISYPS